MKDVDQDSKRFSSRTNWSRSENELTELKKKLINDCQEITDLTVSNPTLCGFNYPADLCDVLNNKDNFVYHADPQGLLLTRKAIASYYQKYNVTVQADQICCTSSTSEAYAYIFRLLCNTDDQVLFPTPSYPLFNFLASIHDVDMKHYRLFYDKRWRIDLESLKQNITEHTKAIVLVHPNNPTGSYVSKEEYEKILEICEQHQLSLVVDEVFLDYKLKKDINSSTLLNNRVLTFTMNGLSKLLALPQMKLSWIILNGPDFLLTEAKERLEVLADTYLSVNIPVQNALETWLSSSEKIQNQILARVNANYSYITNACESFGQCSCLAIEGGWSCVLQSTLILDEEDFCTQLLKNYHTFIHPGYFFDFETEGNFIVSLLTPEDTFISGVTNILNLISSKG